jgi:hypothetical protein
MRIKKLPFLLCLFTILLSGCFAYILDAQSPEPINSIATIIYDMTPPHEGTVQGVPASVNWAFGPRVGMGNNSEGFKAMLAWGQLYEAASGNPATNSRVQIKNIEAYMLSKRDGKWHLLQSSKKVEGAAYRENFTDDVNKPADIRYEPDGSVSVKAGQGYNFHFWSPNGRVLIDPDDVGGIFTTLQARLVIDNPQQADDRSKARYLLSMGADYWLNLTAPWDNWTTNGDIGIGKFKYVTTSWQAFNMITLSPTEIHQNPPPIVMD